MYNKLFDEKLQGKMTNYFANNLAKLGNKKLITKNTIIDPDNSDYVYIVLEGCLKQIIYSPDGTERSLFRLTRGTIFGEMDYFEGARTIVLTRALVNSEISAVPRHILEKGLSKQPEIHKYFMHSIIRKYRIVMLRLVEDNFNDSAGKLASVLLRKAAMQEGGKLEDHVVIDYIYTHQELAAILGSSRITITNTINYFKEMGYISVKNRRIILDNIEGLRKCTKNLW